MRYLLSALLLIGCVKRPPLSPGEQCATQGMVLSGVALNSGGTVARVQVGDQTAYGRAYSSDQSVMCRRAETDRDLCEVAAFAEAARIKDGFSTGWRNALIGVGYITYILPGLVLYLVFDSESDDAGTSANNTAIVRRGACR